MIVDVKNVSKTFVQSGAFPWSPKTKAVREVDIQVAEGEIIAFVGQSGFKTTLSRLTLI